MNRMEISRVNLIDVPISDINECSLPTSPCPSIAECLNTYGSFLCLKVNFNGNQNGGFIFLNEITFVLILLTLSLQTRVYASTFPLSTMLRW